MAYAERVKNDNVGGCTPWDEDSSSGFEGHRRTEMDAFVRPMGNDELAVGQKGERMLLAGMLSDGTILSVPPSAETVLGHARQVTNQMTKDGLALGLFLGKWLAQPNVWRKLSELRASGGVPEASDGKTVSRLEI